MYACELGGSFAGGSPCLADAHADICVSGSDHGVIIAVAV